MAMVGDLEDLSFSELLQILGRGRKSGQLSVWTPSGISRIWFYQGRIVATSPPGEQPTLEHRLSQSPEVRANCGGSSERVISKLATLCCPINQPLGACLRKQGLISAPGLAQLFRQQLRDGVYILFELSTGQFSFNAKAPIPYGEMTGMSKECLDVMVEGLRQIGNQKQQGLVLPDADGCFCRRSEDLPLTRLSPLEWSVWERVSPDKPLQELSLELETDLQTVQLTCGRLLQVGLIKATVCAARLPSPAPQLGDVPEPLRELAHVATPEIEKKEASGSLLTRLTSVLRGIQKSGR